MIKPLFIKKNTPELRKKIEEMGYKLKRNSIPKVDNCICIVQEGSYATFFDLLGNCPYEAEYVSDETDFLNRLKAQK